MVNEILINAGIKYKETRFKKPPETTFAVYIDDINIRGADSCNLIEEHNISIELYEYNKDSESEARIEEQFNALGLEYHKESRLWLEDEQLYQVVYEFEYICKG